MDLLTNINGSRQIIAEASVVPVLKVLSMGAMGSILSHPRLDVMNTEATKLLSKLVFALFLPCLIFTDLGAQVSLQNMMEWWFIPVNVVVSTVLGCLVGYLVALICNPPKHFFRFTVIMTGVGNTGNFPLAIIGSVCHGNTNPFGKRCNQTGVAYVGFSQWIAVIIVYTFVYHMLEPVEEIVVEVEEISNNTGDISPDVNSPDFRPLLLAAEWPGLQDAHNEDFRTPMLATIFRQSSVSSEYSYVSADESPRAVRCLTEPRVVRKLRVVAERTPLQHILQPPIIASLLAITVGMFPETKRVMFGKLAPLGFIDDSFVILADAMVPCIMLVLGGTLSGGPGKSELGLRTSIGICIARLLVLPCIGIGVVHIAGSLGFLPQEDHMFRFVLLLHYSMPSAILTGAMASLRGHGEREAASLLFWQHILAAISITFYIVVYLRILRTL